MQDTLAGFLSGAPQHGQAPDEPEAPVAKAPEPKQEAHQEGLQEAPQEGRLDPEGGTAAAEAPLDDFFGGGPSQVTPHHMLILSIA